MDDFGKPPPSKTVEKATEKTGSNNGTQNETSDEGLLDAQWSDEFIKQTAAQFEQSMQALLSQGIVIILIFDKNWNIALRLKISKLFVLNEKKKLHE